MSSNVVNFSDLNENDQQKYVEFLLQNKFIFTEDQKGDAYNATIKIHMQQSASESSMATLNLPTKACSTSEQAKDKSDLVLMGKENNDQQRQLRASNQGKKALGNAKENIDISTQRKPTTVNNRYSKSPIQKKIAPQTVQQKPQQQNSSILSNITNKQPKQQQNNVSSSLSMKESLNKSKLNSTSSTTIGNVLDSSCLLQTKKSYQNGSELRLETNDDPLKQSVLLETKKQQILEKLQVKLQEANKLAEIEEQQQQQQFLKDLAPPMVQSTAGNNKKGGEQQENLTNRTRRSTSTTIYKQQPQKQNKDSNKENNQDDGARSRRISQDLMQKNKEFITKLQEKNKQKTQKPVRKSVSPSITPRALQQDHIHFNNNITSNNNCDDTSKQLNSGNTTLRRHSNISSQTNNGQQKSATVALTGRSRSNTQENIRNTSSAVSASGVNSNQEKPPSTFDQIMQRQSQLISNVCNRLPNNRKPPLQNPNQVNFNKNEFLQAVSPNTRSPQNGSSSLHNSANSQSSSQRQTIQSVNRNNSKSVPKNGKQNTTPTKGASKKVAKNQSNASKLPEQKVDPATICFEFNSFGSPCNNFEVNQVNLQNQQQQQQQQYFENTQNSNFLQTQQNEIQKRLNFDDDQDEEFKLYNINSKRHRKQNQLGNSMSSNSSNQNGRMHTNNSQKLGYSINHSHTSDISSDNHHLSNSSTNINNLLNGNSLTSSLNTNTNTFAKKNQQMMVEDANEILFDDVTLTEIRQYTDPSLSLRPTKMTLPQLYKVIEELYQTKFMENTLRMKMSSNGQKNKKVHSGIKNELNMQIEVQPYELSFSEFIYEYFKEKYFASKKVSEQHLINLIVSIEFYLKNITKYSPNQILPVKTFAAFIQNTYQKEELIFYLFVREMLLKYTQEGFDSNNIIYETQNIELNLDECQQVLEQVYGDNESKIIDRFMFRLTETLLEQKQTNDYNISATFFLNFALQDYIDGKNNKIYESDGQNESFSNHKKQLQQQQHIENMKEHKEHDTNTCEIMNVQREQQQYYLNQNLQSLKQNNPNINSMNSFEKWEYTFEQSFGEAPHLPLQHLGTKRFSLFSPKNELEEKVWEKMIQKISDFIELVINDNYNEFTIKEKKAKFTSVEKIVTKKVNKMMGALFDADKERWFELLCISRPSSNQLENLEIILNILSNLQIKDLNDICNSEISHFCKTLLQTKELSKAIGKLLVCVLMPDNQS